ncbi:MAG TPA: hypothetical protein VMH32_24270 [Burkholderiales bacterium]|nr:hypothetical protein [Burkholderiales bacterium]
MTCVRLAYYDGKGFDALSKAEVDAIVSECPPHHAGLRGSGPHVAQVLLRPTGPSAAVRRRNGEARATDASPAETKEQVGWGIEGRSIELFERPQQESMLQCARNPPNVSQS